MGKATNPKWERIQATIYRWIQRLLNGTYHHYACHLPENPGHLLSWCLRLFYRGITLAPSQTAVLKKLPKDAVPVYVTKRKSIFERLFYHSRYREARLPVPTLAFDYALFLCQPVSRIFRMLLARLDYFCRHFSFPNAYASGYFAEALSSGQAALLSLVEPHGFRRRFVKQKEDPIHVMMATELPKIDRISDVETDTPKTLVNRAANVLLVDIPSEAYVLGLKVVLLARGVFGRSA